MNVSDFQEQHENMHACGRPALQESREVMSLLPCRKLGVVPTGLPLSPETGAVQ